MRYETNKEQVDKLVETERAFSGSDDVVELVKAHSYVIIEDLTPTDGSPLPDFTMWDAYCECTETLDENGSEYATVDIDFLFTKHLSAVIAEARLSKQ